MSSPKVSVIIPIFNTERYLEQCLDSVLAQSLSDIEVICVDDGSTDSCPNILKDYALRDDRIRIVTKSNSGYGDSVNRGMELATGKYIGFVEPDDWIEKDMFHSLYDAAEENDLDIARGNYWFEYGDHNEPTDFSFVDTGCVVRPSEHKQIFFQTPSIWANLYRKDFLFKNDIEFLPTPGASYQDISFSFKVYSRAERFMLLERRFYHYRVHEGSSSSCTDSKTECVGKEYREVFRYLESNEGDTLVALVLMCNGYKWTYGRLSPGKKEDFEKVWHKDIHDAFDLVLKRASGTWYLKVLLLKVIMVHSYRLDFYKWMRGLYKYRITRMFMDRFA